MSTDVGSSSSSGSGVSFVLGAGDDDEDLVLFDELEDDGDVSGGDAHAAFMLGTAAGSGGSSSSSGGGGGLDEADSDDSDDGDATSGANPGDGSSSSSSYSGTGMRGGGAAGASGGMSALDLLNRLRSTGRGGGGSLTDSMLASSNFGGAARAKQNNALAMDMANVTVKDEKTTVLLDKLLDMAAPTVSAPMVKYLSMVKKTLGRVC